MTSPCIARTSLIAANMNLTALKNELSPLESSYIIQNVHILKEIFAMSASDECSKRKVDFELTADELKAIAAGKSVEIPSSVFFGKTAFTIENAPIPKSVHDKVTVKLEVKGKP
jgi:hypothetical protein